MINVLINLFLMGAIVYYVAKFVKRDNGSNRVIVTTHDGEELPMCVNCQFLVKRIKDLEKGPTISLEPVERQKILDGNYEFMSHGSTTWEIGCYADIWTKDVFASVKDLDKQTIEKKRKNKCFFRRYEKGLNIDKIMAEVKGENV